MKRSREEINTMGPQQKRHMDSSEPQTGVTTEDALHYLKAVKERFKDDDEKYAEFLQVMKDFKAQRIDTTGVIARVKELFKGHNKLIMGFNAFLPKGYEIVLPEESPKEVSKKQPVEFDQAINFVNKIKNRFQDNEQVYKAFLEILNKYRKGTKSINDVYQEVADLFHDHSDLLQEFTCFLPESANCVHATTKPSGNSNHRKDDKSGASSRPSHMVKKEKGTDRENDRVVKPDKERKKNKERDKKDDREKEKEDDDFDGSQRHKRKSARRADELIRKQSQNGEGNPQKDYAYFEKVKARLRSREAYQGFLKILNLYNEQIINRADLQSLVTDILGKYPDLLEGFNDLLIRCENADMDSEGHTKPIKTEKERDKGNEKERERDKDKEKEREKDKEREKEKDRPSKDHKLSSNSNKEKYLSKPISELDLTNCAQCTPSYRLLPRNYPRLVSSHRTEVANSVLNDSWVSVTSGSEDYSFKHMRRNQYEESLFRCEDDRFELDMLLESTKVTAKHVQELVEKLRDDSQVRIDDHLSAINFRCIERIYGDHGLDIIDLLRKNPSVVLPVVYTRLKQKQEEWSKCRVDMNKVWAEVYSKNYHKSLDHRSFYFKQQDRKNLSTKALLGELKEVHHKRKKEDEFIVCTVMGNRRLLTPDLKYTYTDPSVHDDLFRIMKYSADEVCNTMEQSDKIMRVWTMFIEPMFGVASRVRNTEDAEEAAKVLTHNRNSHTLTHTGSSGESTASGSPGIANGNHKAECSTVLDASESSVKVLKKEGSPNKDDNVDGLKSTHAPENHSAAGMEGESRKESSKHPRKGDGKVDREEGELSPSLDMEHQAIERASKAEGDDHEDEEGDESAQKSSEDSENVSEAGEEVSGSESGDQEEGSREENEDDDDEDEDHDMKNESECDGEGMDDAEGYTASSLDRSSMYCRPLKLHDSPDTSCSIFYGNDMFYILFRLHQTLYERIYSAKTNAFAAEQKWKMVKETAPPNLYERFIRVLHNLLDGSADNNKYEDECRSIIGTQSYVLFTLDKLIFKLVKQLQAIAGDEAASKILSLYNYERNRGAGGFNDVVYHANASVLLHDNDIYRYEFNYNTLELSIQLIDHNFDKQDIPATALESSFSKYLTEFIHTSDSNHSHKVYLPRNKRRTEKQNGIMDNVQVLNGLEHKISCVASKVSYVLDTEDLFRRRRYRRSRGYSSRREGRLYQWLKTLVPDR